jgi:EamA domain-containing membrane protein RarD
MPGTNRTAIFLGVAVGILVAIVAFRVIRWPAPAIAVAAGYGAYLLARRRSRTPK